MSACNIERLMGGMNQIHPPKKKEIKKAASRALTFSLRGLMGRLKDDYILLYHFQNKTLHLTPVTMRFDLVARNCQCFSCCADARVFSITVLGLTTVAVDCNCGDSSM